jgi:hypothetical protein
MIDGDIMRKRSQSDFQGHRHRWVGPVIAVFAAPLMSLVLAALFSFESLGYWGNAAAGFIAFLTATLLASLLAGRYAIFSVGVGLGATWGLVAVTVLFRRTAGMSIRSPLVVLTYVVASVLLAHFLGRHERRAIK